MSTIRDIRAREILDSRGWPTLEVDVILASGKRGRAAVPSGASTGVFEACELRDGDVHRFHGKGVTKAISHIHERIRPALQDRIATSQEEIDRILIELDATPQKKRLGANTILGVSLACSKAAAAVSNLPFYRYIADLAGNKDLLLPVPLMNVINGGAHADNSLEIQEFMIVPAGFKTWGEALRAGSEVYHGLKLLLRERKLSTAVGDEGGFAPDLYTAEQALELLVEAIDGAGYRPGKEFFLALDVAASELYKGGCYVFSKGREGAEVYQSSELGDVYKELAEKYPLISLEDPFDQNDWEGWISFFKVLGKSIQIVGDDLFVTHAKRVSDGVRRQAANAVLIKLNQVGTVSETLETIKTARQGGMRVIVSHRSGETEDTTIADFAVGVGAGQIKTGAPCRTDRVCKYNRITRIAEELGSEAPFAGVGIFRR